MGVCFSELETKPTCQEDYPVINGWDDYSGHPALRDYTLGEELGNGAFSTVVLATRKPGRHSRHSIGGEGPEKVALKIVFLGNPNLTRKNLKVLKQECNILERLSHPNIVDQGQLYLWKQKKIMIMEEECLEGLELLDDLEKAITDHGFEMRESFARAITSQVLHAIRYMHHKRIIHRDLKHANLRFKYPASVWTKDPSKMILKVIDFGLAFKTHSSHPEKGLLGTSGFIAPEIIQLGNHTPAMDMYAFGVILFVLLVGTKPMTNRQANTLSYGNTPPGRYINMINNKAWDAVSPLAQDLILKLLDNDPETRLTSKQALLHPWLTKEVEDQQKHEDGMKAGDRLHSSLDLVQTRNRLRWQHAIGDVMMLNRHTSKAGIVSLNTTVHAYLAAHANLNRDSSVFIGHGHLPHKHYPPIDLRPPRH